jgi:hypothetical protein
MKSLKLERKLFLFVLCLFIQSCLSITQEPIIISGPGTLGVHINGKVWNTGGINTYASSIFFHNTKDIRIDAGISRNTDHESLVIVINNVSSIGYYNMGFLKPASLSPRDSTKFLYGDNESEAYHLQSPRNSLVTITRFDTVYNVLAGTFNSSLINNKGDTLKLTDGRFELHLN